MKDSTEQMIRGMSDTRKKRGRWLAAVTALAVLTGGNVFWSLREIGTALTKDGLCTQEAHVHTGSCYDENGTLICGREEHTHTAACFSDENADLETEDIWELTLPERDGIPRQELTARIAESQLGYAESENNFIRSEDGTQHGYSRYGAWYGNPYGEWNTMFVYFCLYYAGVSTEEIPCGGNARTWQVKLAESELIRGPDSDPERGEILLLDLDGDGVADRTGIITHTGEKLTVIEGDCGDAAAETQYAPDAGQILGYVTIPEAEGAPAEETGAASEGDNAPDSSGPMMTYRAESGSGILVDASAPLGAFPAGTAMQVTDVPREDALSTAHLDAGDLAAVAVDISFTDAAGTELEPAGGVDVRITFPETQQLAGEAFTLLHVADDGAVETVEAEIAGDVVTFTADGFSIYILTSDAGYRDVTQTFTVDGNTFPNSRNDPYVIHVGESFRLYSEASPSMPYEHGRQYYTAQAPEGLLTRTYTNTVYPYYSDVSKNGRTVRECEATYQATAPGTATIAVEYETGKNQYFFVKVLEKPQQYYVWRNQQPVRADDLKFNGQSSPNSESNPYIVYVGEQFDIFVSDGSFTLPQNGTDDATKKLDTVNSPALHNNESITYNSQTVSGTRRTFKALNPGTVYCESTVDKQRFYIKVVDPGANYDGDRPALYVRSCFEDKNIHEVKEWLDHFQLPEVNGYIPNAVGKIANRTSSGGWDADHGRPYAIRIGDTFEVYASEAGEFTYACYDLAYDGQTGWNFDLKQTDTNKIVQIPADGSDASGTAVGFRGVEPGEAQITFTDQEGKTQTMWVRVLSENETFDHADMEIADGGKYTVADTTYKDGKKVTTLKVYDAFVSRVNYAILYDDAGEPLALKVKGTDKYEDRFTSDGPTEYVMVNGWSDLQGERVGDYLQIGSQGGTQYELSSAYGRTKDYNGNDVKTVKFDVNVTLKPEKQCTITDGVIGSWETISGESDSVVPNVIWVFDQQGITDAINKCPMTNGLDFTLRANAALVDLKAVKKLDGGDLTAGQFTFRLYDQNEQPVGEPVTNDADGNIVFLNQKYEEAGSYRYTIREMIPTDGTRDQQLIYATDQEIMIDVTEISVPDGQGGSIKALKAEMRNPPPTLTNYVTFRLPDTGGAGTLPWYLGGGMILAAAVLLLERKRAREIKSPSRI